MTLCLLGSSETSARTGAVYALHELALEEEKYRQQIVQIQAFVKKNQAYDCNKTATNRSPSYFFCINEVKVM
jgi:hypothetical protein